MANRKYAPTIKDVAQEAGVAMGTVSKVINGIPVNEDYRIRVEKAIEKLNYRVNIYAQGMRRSCTHTIEVMIPNLVNPFFARLVHFINRELSQRNYKMMLSTTDGNPYEEQAHVFLAEQQRVDGLICLSYNLKLEMPKNFPVVSIDRYFGSGIPCVASDNYAGGYLAAKKLIENGCGHLAFFRRGTYPTNETSKRKDGFVNACEEFSVPYTLKIVDSDTPYSVFEEFLQEHIHNGKLDFGGIFCVTDFLAHRIRNSLRNMGIRIPEDVQIIGYDGVPHLEGKELPCSTIVQPVERIAKSCVDLVLDYRPNTSPSLVCLPVTYAYGGTTRQ